MITGNVTSAITLKPQMVKVEDNKYINANCIESIETKNNNENILRYRNADGSRQKVIVNGDAVREIMAPSESNLQIWA